MRKLSRKTIIAIAIAMALVFGGAIGSFALTSSGLPYESRDYRADFYLNHLQVHLLENGRDVCGGENTLDGTTKVSGELAQYLGYRRADGEEILGSVEPGKLYREEIAAKNGQDIPIYVRMTVKKYWMITNDDLMPVEKATELTPDMIRLTSGKADYNKDKWFLNKSESTAEQATYYYREQVAPNAETEPLFDSLMIDGAVMEKEKLPPVVDEKTGVTTIRYKYKYSGYAFFIKADVQAIQTHNATDAIHSQWGVYDITEKDGTLSPKN